MAEKTQQEEVDPATETLRPGALEVEYFHTNSDLDTRAEAQHHTLGPGTTQASPGSHRHDGGDSALLLEGLTLTGSRGGNVALNAVISALVRLGAVDNTTN